MPSAIGIMSHPMKVPGGWRVTFDIFYKGDSFELVKSLFSQLWGSLLTELKRLNIEMSSLLFLVFNDPKFEKEMHELLAQLQMADSLHENRGIFHAIIFEKEV